MRRVIVALIIKRNRYLIPKITSGRFRGQWEFPSAPANTGITDFEVITTTLRETLGIEVFPYLNVKNIVYKSTDGPIALTLIQCSISDKEQAALSVKAPLRDKWIFLPYVADIAFAPRDQTIASSLTDGVFLRPKRRKSDGNRRKGFASMDPEKRRMIAGLGGKAAHASGMAHKWTPVEASRAGRIGGKAPKGSKRR